MPLDPNRFTRKTTEALQAASAAARDAGHTDVGSDHILGALLDQSEGVVSGVLERIGVLPDQARTKLVESLAKRPKVSGATVRDPQLAPEAYRLLEEADKRRAQLDDDYVSTEHILLALTEMPGGMG